MSVVVGWTLGYLRLPYIEKNYSFWAGFLACVGFVLFVLVTNLLWGKSGLFNSRTQTSSVTEVDDEYKSPKKLGYSWLMILTAAIVVGLAVGFIINRQDMLQERQVSLQNQKYQEILSIAVSNQKSNQYFLTNNIIEKIKLEQKVNNSKAISDALISEISGLCQSFQPFQYFDGDSLSSYKRSPARGQLLLSLIVLDLDSISFNKIKKRVSFSHSDLRGVRLDHLDLSGIDLSHSDLQGSNLKGSDLSFSNLRKANMWDCSFDSANLSYADIRQGILSWSEMNNVTVTNSNLDGCLMENVKARNSKFTGSTMQLSTLNGSIFKHSQLDSVDLVFSVLNKANFNGASFKWAVLRKADLTDASLKNTTLNHTEVEELWFNNFSGWQLEGSQDILSNYLIYHDSTNVGPFEKYRLFTK